ncbi:anaphase promoting complex subunit 5 [Entophlyctis luteolus]|nr:anaphase promoting complex subunit 5 [Entophlyctis luteolus]
MGNSLLTPTTFSFLIILVEYCLEDRPNSSWNVLGACEKVLRFLLDVCSGNTTFERLSDISDELNSLVVVSGDERGSVTLNAILHFQLNKISSISNVDAVFDTAEALIDDPLGANDPFVDSAVQRLKRTSELGIFARHLVADYRAFSFSELAAFYDEVIELRNSHQKHGNPYHGLRISEVSSDKLLNFYAVRKRYSGKEFLNSMSTVLLDIQEKIPENIKVHYLEIALHLRNFVDAEEKLRQFFDYAESTSGKSLRQYGLLALSALHSSVGRTEASLASLQESIATARASKDFNCLNYSLKRMHVLHETCSTDSFINEDILDAISSGAQSLELNDLLMFAKNEYVKQSIAFGYPAFQTLSELPHRPLSFNSETGEARDADIELLVNEEFQNGKIYFWDSYGFGNLSKLYDQPQNLEANVTPQDAGLKLARKAEKMYFDGQCESAKELILKSASAFGHSDIHFGRILTFTLVKLEFLDALNRCLPYSNMAGIYAKLSPFADLRVEWKLEISLLHSAMLFAFGDANKALETALSLLKFAKAVRRNRFCLSVLLFVANLHMVNPIKTTTHI